MTATLTPRSVLIPGALASAVEGERLAGWALEALVLGAVGENQLSTGEAAELLGLGYFEMEALLKERGVPLVLTDEEREEDEADMRTILSPTIREHSTAEGASPKA